MNHTMNRGNPPVLLTLFWLWSIVISSVYAHGPHDDNDKSEQRYGSNFYHKSKYGGYKHIKFEATGYFYLHQDKRWWFVDPEGHAFFAFGINHVEPSRGLYTWNKPYWARKFGLDIEAPASKFKPHFMEKMKDDLTAFGFNSLGCHNNAMITSDFRKHEIPYVKKVEFVRLNHYQTHTKNDFPDVWSQSYLDNVKKIAREKVTPIKDDPYLLGYFMTACPIYTDLEAAHRPNTIHGSARSATPTWPNVIRNMDPSNPGKQKYLSFIKERYKQDIQAFNKVYQTQFKSFEALERENWRPGIDETNESEQEDNAQFLFLIVDMAYKTQTEAIRTIDKNHLIFGDKVNANADTRDEIVELAGKYFDLIYYGYYALNDDHMALMDKWSKLTNKPFFSADCGINTPCRQMPDPYGPHAPTQEMRAERTYEVLDRCFSRDYFVGWGQCGWIDQWHVGESPLLKQHGGLQDPFGNYHLPMLRTLSHFSALMYHKYSKED